MAKDIISVQKLTKKFKDFVAVDAISFDVQKGEIFAFLGPNGAGKSTTIKMITTILEPTGGKILINGHDPVVNETEARKAFGIVFQDPSLDDELTALENMQIHAALYRVSKDIRAKRIKDMLEFVELWERRDSLVKTFSGGMKRRLEIARGLLHHPKILFLDEPTLGLDPQTRNHMWNYLKKVNETEGMTIFFTTHYMEEAQKNAQRIAIIDHGKIIATGTSNQLIKKTKKKTLEEAFIELTGSAIRDQEATGLDHLRARSKMWRRR